MNKAHEIFKVAYLITFCLQKKEQKMIYKNKNTVKIVTNLINFYV